MGKFIVVGAGVVGVATAWQLCRTGHSVTLVDRNDGPSGGASRRNGAQLSYSYCDALASPGLLARMPSILFGRDDAFRVRIQADPGFLLWGLRFLLNSTPSAFRRNTSALLALASATERLLPQLMAEFSLSFDYEVAGKLVLCHSAESFLKARANVKMKSALGVDVELLTQAEAMRVEPALEGYADRFAGAVYSPNDAVGSPSRFSEELVAGLVSRYGLRTLYRCEAREIVLEHGRVAGIAFRNNETERCDGVVVATGYDTHLLGKRTAFASIWPVQGYSVTVPARSDAIRVSITDPKRRLVFARLGEAIRIAGIADIGSRQFTFDQSRFETLKRGAASAFPGSFDQTADGAWSDARPCTPSSQPLIGRGKVSGLYLNLGHGTLGWTLCLGSAERLAAVIADDRA
ncbi:FAD-dependent oxidoreductase [Mesorhizobium sp.]|uniref:FAD-dependent oxidoreductase n=1 Tax=Mesorhizobium sp. TaxID=1871066 RepID=UPI000FE564C6|nr:FAD-dependent oxidoreductase [Mesorhizobium sp.]RWP51071.1 MAG: FAD-dependent oxidoreductase [Mesorhizobium sp.]